MILIGIIVVVSSITYLVLQKKDFYKKYAEKCQKKFHVPF